MKRLAISFLVAAVTSTTLVAAPTTEKEKLSYSIGYQIGVDFGSRSLDVDVNTVVEGMKDAASGKPSTMTTDAMEASLTAMQERIKKEQLAKFKKVAEENRLRSEKFLKENKKKKGIVVLPSGIQYRIIEEGSGRRPKLSDTVSVHYRGSLMDGFEFDSSFARGVPQSFKVDTVLKGWQEILPLMQPGDKWQVFVPPELAYGLRGQKPIGPNEALVFDINLLEVKPEG